MDCDPVSSDLLIMLLPLLFSGCLAQRCLLSQMLFDALVSLYYSLSRFLSLRDMELKRLKLISVKFGLSMSQWISWMKLLLALVHSSHANIRFPVEILFIRIAKSATQRFLHRLSQRSTPLKQTAIIHSFRFPLCVCVCVGFSVRTHYEMSNSVIKKQVFVEFSGYVSIVC